jgi:hypothetical protein
VNYWDLTGTKSKSTKKLFETISSSSWDQKYPADSATKILLGNTLNGNELASLLEASSSLVFGLALQAELIPQPSTIMIDNLYATTLNQVVIGTAHFTDIYGDEWSFDFVMGRAANLADFLVSYQNENGRIDDIKAVTSFVLDAAMGVAGGLVTGPVGWVLTGIGIIKGGYDLSKQLGQNMENSLINALEKAGTSAMIFLLVPTTKIKRTKKA